jgi:hypothetical protein
MAFLICYSSNGVTDWRNKVIYLDQCFYEDIFRHCAKHPEYTVLAKISSLGYGDELVLSRNQLMILHTEVFGMRKIGCASHDQFIALSAVIQAALDEKMELGISGDMYPVL